MSDHTFRPSANLSNISPACVSSYDSEHLVSIENRVQDVKRAIHPRLRGDRDARVRNNPRTILFWILAVFLATVGEGALRKWALPPALAGAAYFLKDAIVLSFVLSHPLPKEAAFLRRLREGVAIIAALLLVPFGIGLAGGAAGAIAAYKNAVLWPLFAVHLAPRLVGLRLSMLTFVLALTAVAEAGLATVQFYSPMTSWINRYAWTSDFETGGVSLFGSIDNVRATGTFSYIAGLAAFSIFAFSLLLWRAVGTRNGRERRIAWVGVVAAIACGILTGARATVVSEGVVLLGLPLVSRSARHTFLALLCFAVAAGAVTLALPDAVFGLVQRWELAGDTTFGRITGEGLKSDYWDLIAKYPLGIGMGAVGGYSAFVNGESNLSELGFDHGGSKAVVETGALGYCAMILIWLTSARMFWRGAMSRSASFRLSTACLGILPLYQVCSNIWYDHNATALYWMLLGLWLSTDSRVFSRKAVVARPVLRCG
jgi:hypothetical protein